MNLISSLWHSTQRNDPGLNVASYTNTKVDKILEDASVIVNKEARLKNIYNLRKKLGKICRQFFFIAQILYTSCQRI